ncbi:acyltransferase family protein [Sandarakinorhabdus limnophila]|uniref:acyltransferase family protein n=1 Tax=Sandarakinorhabdus limnophila TaxID=210512 RepID=UPI0026E996C9|nr:acyltransferase [Sandarakinorhabdus limnophila]MCM0034092.1 acyltransferase [Sandarakinorhabdus limnophila]
MRSSDLSSGSNVSGATASSKLVHLECARGIASVIVIFNHFCVAFLPGMKTSFMNGGLQLTPVYFILNGSGAVIFFFLLSGFVLTQGFFRNPAPVALLRSVVKRLPRLMLPVSVTIMAGFLILKSGSAPYQLAAEISGSQWLHDFGNAKFPQGFTPTLASAVQQFLSVFLFSNNSYYNSNLWTMRDEFLGSLLVFAISAVFLYRRFRAASVMIPAHLGLIVASFFLHIAFVPFLVGSGLAYLMVVQNLTFTVSNRQAIVLLCAAAMAFSVDNLPVVGILPAVFGSVLVMVALLGNAGLAEKLSGKYGLLLGQLSFPLYLVHTLVIMSLASAVVVWLTGLGISYGVVVLVAFAVTLAATAVFSMPLVRLESFWVPWLNGYVRDVTKLPARLQH